MNEKNRTVSGRTLRLERRLCVRCDRFHGSVPPATCRVLVLLEREPVAFS